MHAAAARQGIDPGKYWGDNLFPWGNKLSSSGPVRGSSVRPSAGSGSSVRPSAGGGSFVRGGDGDGGNGSGSGGDGENGGDKGRRSGSNGSGYGSSGGGPPLSLVSEDDSLNAIWIAIRCA